MYFSFRVTLQDTPQFLTRQAIVPKFVVFTLACLFAIKLACNTIEWVKHCLLMMILIFLPSQLIPIQLSLVNKVGTLEARVQEVHETISSKSDGIASCGSSSDDLSRAQSII